MPTVFVETLMDFAHYFNLSDEVFRQKISLYPENPTTHSPSGIKASITITESEKAWLDLLPVTCPCCKENKANCRFTQEYRFIQSDLQAAESALKKLEGSPFRQFRNAYGFAATISGGWNIFLTNCITLSAPVSLPLLIVPALLLGAFVYLRGRREEVEINAKLQCDIMAKKISLFQKHGESVGLRVADTEAKASMSAQPRTALRPTKENRGILGNPFSHFIGGSFATISMGNAIIKCATAASLMGGPVPWIIAGAVALGVGLYFAYQRYQHLNAKKEFERQMENVEARIFDIVNDIKGLKNSQPKAQPNNEPASPSPGQAHQRRTTISKYPNRGVAMHRNGFHTRRHSMPNIGQDPQMSTFNPQPFLGKSALE